MEFEFEHGFEFERELQSQVLPGGLLDEATVWNKTRSSVKERKHTIHDSTRVVNNTPNHHLMAVPGA